MHTIRRGRYVRPHSLGTRNAECEAVDRSCPRIQRGILLHGIDAFGVLQFQFAVNFPVSSVKCLRWEIESIVK